MHYRFIAWIANWFHWISSSYEEPPYVQEANQHAANALCYMTRNVMKVFWLISSTVPRNRLRSESIKWKLDRDSQRCNTQNQLYKMLCRISRRVFMYMWFIYIVHQKIASVSWGLQAQTGEQHHLYMNANRISAIPGTSTLRWLADMSVPACVLERRPVFLLARRIRACALLKEICFFGLLRALLWRRWCLHISPLCFAPKHTNEIFLAHQWNISVLCLAVST